MFALSALLFQQQSANASSTHQSCSGGDDFSDHHSHNDANNANASSSSFRSNGTMSRGNCSGGDAFAPSHRFNSPNWNGGGGGGRRRWGTEEGAVSSGSSPAAFATTYGRNANAKGTACDTPAYLLGADLRPSTVAMVRGALGMGPQPMEDVIAASLAADGGGGDVYQHQRTLHDFFPAASGKKKRGSSSVLSASPTRLCFTFPQMAGGGLMRAVTLVGCVYAIRPNVPLGSVAVKGGVPIDAPEHPNNRKGNVRRGRGGRKRQYSANDDDDFMPGADGLGGGVAVPPCYTFKARPAIMLGCPTSSSTGGGGEAHSYYNHRQQHGDYNHRRIRQDKVHIITLCDGSGFIDLVLPIDLREEEDDGGEEENDHSQHNGGHGCHSAGAAALAPSSLSSPRSPTAATNAAKAQLERLRRLELLADDYADDGDNEGVDGGGADPSPLSTSFDARAPTSTSSPVPPLVDTAGIAINLHDYLYCVAYPSTELDNDSLQAACAPTDSLLLQPSMGEGGYRLPSVWGDGYQQHLGAGPYHLHAGADAAPPTDPHRHHPQRCRVYAMGLRTVENASEVAHHQLSVLVARQRLLKGGHYSTSMPSASMPCMQQPAERADSPHYLRNGGGAYDE